MKFDFNMPTQILTGYGVIRENADKFALGKKALIVSGRHSAKACGAFDDITAVLSEKGIEWAVYPKIVENPPVSVCYEGGQFATAEKADFIIAIGGGSPMDAAKAIAAYAANPTLAAMDIYTAVIENKPLPIIAVPTTAGTGSEVDAVAVMTIDGKNVKKSFKTPDTYPRYAFVDPKYAESLNREYTVSTALDALSHCIESYLSPKSTVISMMFAATGAKLLWSALSAIENLPDDLEALKPYRETLAMGATFGGVAINTTGTGFNHPLGYNLTFYHNIPHGRACGVFMREYFDYNMRTEEGMTKIKTLCYALAASADGQSDEILSPESVADRIVSWSNVHVKVSDEDIELYIQNVGTAKNYANSPYVINDDEKREIYRRLFQ